MSHKNHPGGLFGMNESPYNSGNTTTASDRPAMTMQAIRKATRFLITLLSPTREGRNSRINISYQFIIVKIEHPAFNPEA